MATGKMTVNIRLTELEPFRKLISDLDRMIGVYDKEENAAQGYFAITTRFKEFKEEMLKEREKGALSNGMDNTQNVDHR